MTGWPKFSRGGYEIFVDDTGTEWTFDRDAPPSASDFEGLHKAKLMRVTGILDWAIKGDGFGAMPYYGAGLLADFLFPDFDEELLDGVMALWKESKFDPNKKLKSDAYRGTQAHQLYQHLCQGETELLGQTSAVIGGEILPAWWIRGQDGLEVIATEYDAGVCEAYHDVFQHFDPGETLSEVKVYWTEHPIQECPDEVCQHGFAGTLDQLIPAERIMADMKTNKGDARWAAYPQMAMYGRAALQRGLIDGPIEKQIVVIPRPTPGEDGKMYELFDDKFVGDEIVDPVLEIYKQRRAWGPR